MLLRDAHSPELRQAILGAREQSLSYSEVATMLGIGYATVNRILRLHRETTRSSRDRPGAATFLRSMAIMACRHRRRDA
ncbi:helix-turn-helix domain-containing protein [Pendulispora brunnea]|uniref:helix-turn-helix domain-containing protein n=1 Tax=Pendulispora brunnea TaxID=2905690 RepID=UPI00374DFF81